MTKHFNQDTGGWIISNDVKGQCERCVHVVVERKMAACDYNRKDFGDAHNCPLFLFNQEAE